METHHFVAHVSPRSGAATDRIKRARIATLAVLENVARAYSVDEAHEGLMSSPGHRANILSEDATHVGVGVELGAPVAGRPQIYVTQLFAKLPNRVGAARARREAHRRVEAHGLAVHAELSFVADGFAHAIAAGMPAEKASQLWGRQLSERTSGEFGRVQTVIATMADIASFDPSTSLREGRYTLFGTGVARGNHADLGDGVWTVVLLLAVQ